MQLSRIFSIAAAITTLSGQAAAQQTLDTLPLLVERNMSGPRFGLTYVGIKKELKERLPPGEFHRVISQFGWHFEYQITPDGGGPQFLLQFVPMVAGVEHGMFIPNATLAVGIRLPGGFESGIGPNFQLPKNLEFDRGKVTSALVVAVGKTFHYGGVSIPFDIVYAFNPNGNRVSFVLGYAIQRTRSRRIGRR